MRMWRSAGISMVGVGGVGMGMGMCLYVGVVVLMCVCVGVGVPFPVVVGVYGSPFPYPDPSRFPQRLVRPDQDCLIRQQALQFATTLCKKECGSMVSDALELSTLCQLHNHSHNHNHNDDHSTQTQTQTQTQTAALHHHQHTHTHTHTHTQQQQQQHERRHDVDKDTNTNTNTNTATATVAGSVPSSSEKWYMESCSLVSVSRVVYVSVSGSDAWCGSSSYPVLSLRRAVMLSRSIRNGNENGNGNGNGNDSGSATVTIELGPGTYELDQTIILTHVDSGTHIKGQTGSSVVISGGRMLSDLLWSRVSARVPIYAAVLPDHINVNNTFHLNQLFATKCTPNTDTNKRMIRARYPNGDPEFQGLHTLPWTWLPAQAAINWIPSTYNTNNPNHNDKHQHKHKHKHNSNQYKQDNDDAAYVYVDSPNRPRNYVENYHMQLGGALDKYFDPARSFWGFAVPSGVQYNASMFSPNVGKWSNPSTGFVHAFHEGHWASWMFGVSSVDVLSSTILFGRGGMQEARGAEHGAEFFVENIFEELDSPGEWYVDEQTRTLYYYFNDTDTSPCVVVSQLPYLISLSGSSFAPVVNVTIENIIFAHASSTFMQNYLVPSGGDWALHPKGVITATGTQRLTILNNTFVNNGGNAIVIHGYSRDANISHNEIVWNGDSGIILCGIYAGIDAGTSGEHPVGTEISYNLIHETGIFAKQSAPIFSAISALTHIVGNVIFNAPRAGINFNDGFGGGSVIEQNLIFNMVRETLDHGPFNSWDRMPFLSTYKDGVTSQLTPKNNTLSRNFIINNFHGVWPIDHDDGTCFYHQLSNVLVYGGFKNYLGHSRLVRNNLYLYPDAKTALLDIEFVEPWCATSQSGRHDSTGYDDIYVNNTCLLSVSDTIYWWVDVPVSGWDNVAGVVPFTDGTVVYMSASLGFGDPTIIVNSDPLVELPLYKLTNYPADQHTQVFHTLPNDNQLITLIHQTLHQT